MRNATSSITGSTSGGVTGDWFYIGNMSKASIISKVVGDGAAAGTVSLEISNDAAPSGSIMPFTPSISLALATPTITVSGNTTLATTVFDVAYQWARLVFTRSAGSGGVITVEFAAHD
jgi:hypothetical protein